MIIRIDGGMTNSSITSQYPNPSLHHSMVKSNNYVPQWLYKMDCAFVVHIKIVPQWLQKIDSTFVV